MLDHAKRPHDVNPHTGYCRSHELNQLLIGALYAVSRALSRSLDFNDTLAEVLRVLHEEADLTRGLIAVVDGEGQLAVHAMYSPDGDPTPTMRYRSGEGVLGALLETPRTFKTTHLGQEPRFLNRLERYDRNLPFIAVPIRLGSDLKGVLAVQPMHPDEGLLDERTQFVEMVANLVGQNLRLATEVIEEKSSLVAERDSLRRQVRREHGFDSMVGHSTVMRRIFDQARMVAKWNTTVLIRGETGTGKELIAKIGRAHV